MAQSFMSDFRQRHLKVEQSRENGVRDGMEVATSQSLQVTWLTLAAHFN